jgi:hypothetical protein
MWSRIGTALGTVGALIVLGAYFFNQYGLLSSGHWLFPGSNLIGAALILFSLFIEPNIPSILLESAWFLISLFGLAKAFFLADPT